MSSQQLHKEEVATFNVRKYLLDLIDLRKGVDKRATIAEIRHKQAMNGANAWMLMSSIAIASVGLNLNSQAVINKEFLD